MATTYKILGQVSPLAVTETEAYNVTTTSAVVSTITICNTNVTDGTFRVSVSQDGAPTSTKDYIYYDLILAGNDTFAATMGITLAANDKIRVYTSAANFAVNIFGQENS